MKSAKTKAFIAREERPKQSPNFFGIASLHSVSLAMTILILLFTSTISFAQNIPERPNPPRLVNDFANILSADERESLEQKLDAYADSTSTQIAIVTIQRLDGDAVEDYAASLGEKWGVGEKDKHNGIVILLAMQDRKVDIATGYGVEDGLNTNVCKQIRENIMTPRLKEGNYYAAFDDATNAIFDVLAGKFVNENPQGNNDKNSLPTGVIMIIIIIFIIIIIANRNNRGGGFISSGGFFPMGGGFGGGFSGGSSGGGFSGFGGGSFSGGGSGGSW